MTAAGRMKNMRIKLRKLMTIRAEAFNSFNCQAYKMKFKYESGADNIFFLVLCKVRESRVSVTPDF